MTLQELLTSLTRDLHAADTDAPALEAPLWRTTQPPPSAP